MKNKLPIFGSIFIVLIIMVIVGIVSYNSGYTRGYIEGYSKVGAGEICALDTDCKTPMGYLSRSSCPFTSKCIDGKCRVVCIGPYKTEQDQLNKIPQCNKNTDCNCATFYPGDDIKNCLCIDGLCIAIVS